MTTKEMYDILLTADKFTQNTFVQSKHETLFFQSQAGISAVIQEIDKINCFQFF